MMKLRLVSIFLVVTLISALLFGCSQGTTQKDQSTPQKTNEVKNTTVEKEKPRVGLVIGLGGLGDKSFNDQANEGLMKAEKEFNLDTKVLEPNDASEIEDMQTKLATMGYKLVILNGFDHMDALNKVADQFPNTEFTIIDSVVDKANVLSITYSTHEGSFLAGAIAAMRSKSNIIGFVGGMDIPTIKKFAVGYEEGAKYIKPDIKVLSKYIGSDSSAFGNPAMGKQITIDLASQKCDVVYHAAGGSGTGVIAGAKEAGIFAIGCNLDQEALAPDTVITSMLTKGEVAVYEAAKKFVAGEKLSGILEMNLKNDGVGVTLSKNLTDEEKQKVEAIKKDIIDGKIKVTDATKSE